MGTHFSFSATLLIIMASTSKVMAQATIVLGCLTTLALARWEVTSYPWEAKEDLNGRVFYVNHATKGTQWERPPANVWRMVNGDQMNWVEDSVPVQPSVDSSSDDNECEVCMERPKSEWVYFQCGHKNYCEECADAILKSRSPICPECRAAAITQTRQRRLLSM